eukprot:2087133-Lingulodinium_polyedra.AAC.1
MLRHQRAEQAAGIVCRHEHRVEEQLLPALDVEVYARVQLRPRECHRLGSRANHRSIPRGSGLQNRGARADRSLIVHGLFIDSPL